MIDGKIVKNRRRELGISQKELAVGITTQATISSFERNKVVPRSELLSKIALRLGLDLNDIITGDDGDVTTAQRLAEADGYCMNYQYDHVLEVVGQLATLTEPSQEAHRLFLKTDALMWQNHNYEDAIFAFNQILQLPDHRNDVYTALATCELGVAYAMKDKNHDKAGYFFEKLPDLMRQFKWDEQVFWTLFLLDNLSKYYSNSRQKAKCETILKTGLHFAKQQQTFVFVDQFYFLLATENRNLNGGSWNEVAIANMVSAYSFAKFARNEVVMEKAAKHLKEIGQISF